MGHGRKIDCGGKAHAARDNQIFGIGEMALLARTRRSTEVRKFARGST
jgi:hypothetical protein